MKNNKEKHMLTKAKREQEALKWLASEEGFTFIPTTSKWESFDDYITSGDTLMLGEVKVRTNYTSQQIKDFGGAYAEFTKVEGIRQFKEANNEDISILTPVLYICFWKDCCEIYRLHTVPNVYEWELAWLPKNDYDDTMVWKHITKLNDDQLIKTIYYK